MTSERKGLQGHHYTCTQATHSTSSQVTDEGAVFHVLWTLLFQKLDLKGNMEVRNDWLTLGTKFMRNFIMKHKKNLAVLVYENNSESSNLSN